MPHLDDLVSDMQQVLKNVEDGDSYEIDSDALADFGLKMAVHVQKALSGKPYERKAKTIYISELGKPCQRETWYKHHDGEREKLLPSAHIKFLYGNILEELLLFLAQVAGHDVTEQQGVCEHDLGNGWNLRGRIDAVIDGEVVDVKSTSSFGFDKFRSGTLERDDPFGYIVQLASYKKLKNNDKRGGFLAIDKQNGHIVLYRPEKQVDVIKLAQHLSKVLERDTPPDRAFDLIPDGKSGNMKLPTNCGYCAFKFKCWADANNGHGLRVFSYSGKPVFLGTVAKQPRVDEITHKFLDNNTEEE